MTDTSHSLWYNATKAAKLGPIPVQYVGKTVNHTMESCAVCALRPGSKKPGSGRCYYWESRPHWAHRAIMRTAALDPDRYKLRNVLKRVYSFAKVARMGMGGNPSWLGVDVVLNEAQQLEANGLTPIGYDHDWRNPDVQPLKGTLMASCETFADARHASRLGWVPALIVPKGTTQAVVTDGKGHRYKVCDATHERGQRVSCGGNPLTGQPACGGKLGPFCHPKNELWTKHEFTGIAFPAHDSRAKPKPLPTATLQETT